ncbi:MAG: DUF5698 domain-containing protein [Anaerolineae bacterium]|nr:DUF5698 domain-containing protein [Anaerolineae bacterium]
MELILTTEAWLGAGLIFLLRVIDMTLATLRFMVTLRGQRFLSWVLGFVQSIVFVAAISSVLDDLDNILNLVGYAAGFATGTVIGMGIEERLAIGYTHLRIISPTRGAKIAENLREAGYAVTEVSGRGRDGMVTLINASVRRKNIKRVRAIVEKIDAEAFMTAEDLRPVRRGFWRT